MFKVLVALFVLTTTPMYAGPILEEIGEMPEDTLCFFVRLFGGECDDGRNYTPPEKPQNPKVGGPVSRIAPSPDCLPNCPPIDPNSKIPEPITMLLFGLGATSALGWKQYKNTQGNKS